MKQTRAYETGKKRAVYLRSLGKQNIFGCAENPYKRPTNRKAWNDGFHDEYNKRESAQ